MKEFDTDMSAVISSFAAPKAERNCFCGEINKEMTPECLIRLTEALAGTLSPGAKIVLSLSDKTEYLMIKFAVLSALIASGAEAYNIIDAGDRSVAKFILRHFAFDAGIHIQVEGNNISFEVLNRDGCPADENMMNDITESLKSGKTHRPATGQFLPPVNASKIPLYYFKDLVAKTCCRRLKFTGVICTTSSETQTLMKKIGSAFGLSLLFINDKELLPEFIADNHADFGLLIGSNGKTGLYDEHGRVLSGDTYYNLVTLIVLSANASSTVFMPTHATGTTEEIAEICGGKIVRVPEQELEQKLAEAETATAELQYDLCFDPIRGMIRICEFLYLNQCRLSYVCSLLPMMYKISRYIDCPEEKKSDVMHKILSGIGAGETIDLTEGIKIVDGRGWVLIIPNGKDNKINIVSESHDAEIANEIAGDIYNSISSFLQGE